MLFLLFFIFLGYNNYFIEKNVKSVVLDRNICGLNEFII